MATPPTGINQGDLYFCEPAPKDTVGSEIDGDHVWVIVSLPKFHRGNCVVGLPLSRHSHKALAHLIAIPAAEITGIGSNIAINRVALTDQIRALDKTRLRRKAGHVSHKVIGSILLGLDYLFGNMRIPATALPKPAAPAARAASAAPEAAKPQVESKTPASN